MAKDKNNTMQYAAFALLLLGGGIAAYSLMGNNAPADSTPTQVPPGGVVNTPYGQWTNNTGQPTWLTATGVIYSGTNQLLGNIADLINAINQGNGSGGGSAGGTAVTGRKRSIGYLHPYYNPLPGGLM